MSLRQKISLAIFIVIGTIIQVIPTIRSGLNYSFGTGFWGPSGHDSVWHLSLINHISNPFSIDMPIYSGSKLVNYHPFYDILIAFLSYITHVSSSVWLFQIFPIFSSVIFLYLSYILGKKITKTHFGGLILLSLNTLANSFGWMVTLIRNQKLDGESIFWAMQSPSNQINPPFQLSLIFILILLIIVINKQTRPKLTAVNYAIIFLIMILSPITKAYSIVIIFSIFGLYSIYTAKKYRNYYNLIFMIFSSIIAGLVFLHYNPNTSSLFLFKPFWFVNSMIESSDRVFIPKLASIRYTLESTNRIGPRLIIVYLISALLFIIGNFSWRLLGIISLIKKPNFIKYILGFNILILTIIPTLFIQKGTSWNTIQFLYYALFLSNIFLAIYLSKTNKFILSIIFFTYIISFYGTINNYLGKISPTALPPGEKKALNFLSQQTKGVVLTVPYDPYIKKSFEVTPIPLYAYETTAYVSAFSHQFTFLEDEMNLNNSGYDFVTRRKQSLEFFNQKNTFQDRGFLINNQIKYIYIAGVQQQLYRLDTLNLYLTEIYKNTDATIYLVQR